MTASDKGLVKLHNHFGSKNARDFIDSVALNLKESLPMLSPTDFAHQSITSKSAMGTSDRLKAVNGRDSTFRN